MNFTRLMQEPELQARYKKVKRFFHIKESAYDVTSVCQLRCDGCYYFAGDKYKIRDNRDPALWRDFLCCEKQRGINYVNLAGAEPSLVPDILKACYETIPLGTVFTNGLKCIDSAIRYRIHISIWGSSAGDPLYRKRANGQPGPDCISAQLKNYKNDSRVVFVYTFNNANVAEVDEVVKKVCDEGHKITFNIFSAPVASGSLLSPSDALLRIRDKMFTLIDNYGKTIIYSDYNAEVHTHPLSLRARFDCPYPRAIAEDTNPIGLGATFRSYRADFSHVRTSDCCIPDTDCRQCRHYAAGSAIVTHRLDLHTQSEPAFRAWLDYVDTYLAVWLMDYEKGPNLYKRLPVSRSHDGTEPPV